MTENPNTRWTRTPEEQAEAEAVLCEFCGDPVGKEGAGSTTCDWCWYGQRMDAKAWVRRLRKKGRHVIYQGGCIHVQITEGDGRSMDRQKKVVGAAIVCRNPYKPDDGR